MNLLVLLVCTHLYVNCFCGADSTSSYLNILNIASHSGAKEFVEAVGHLSYDLISNLTKTGKLIAYRSRVFKAWLLYWHTFLLLFFLICFPISIESPDSLETFPDTCKGNFLCLQIISFEFLRVASIRWIVSRGKHFVRMTRPGRVIGQRLVFPSTYFSYYDVYYDTTSQQVVFTYEFNSPNYSILFSMAFKLFLCELDGYIYI